MCDSRNLTKSTDTDPKIVLRASWPLAARAPQVQIGRGWPSVTGTGPVGPYATGMSCPLR